VSSLVTRILSEVPPHDESQGDYAHDFSAQDGTRFWSDDGQTLPYRLGKGCRQHIQNLAWLLRFLLQPNVFSWTVKRTKNLLSDFGVTFRLFLDTYYDTHNFMTQAGIYPSESGAVRQAKDLLWRQSLLHQESTL
jgi:hypothetical protein